MKKITLVLTGITILNLIAVNKSYAAESSVTIHNTVNSTNTNTVNSTSKCHTRTEVNGKVVESDDCNVDIHNDGTDVSIKNNASPNSPDSPTPKTTLTPTKTPHPTLTDEQKEKINKATQEAKQKVEEMKHEQKDFFKKLEEWIQNFFKSLF